MTVLVSSMAALAFVVAFVLLRVIPASLESLRILRAALAVMRNPEIDDHAREKAMRVASLRLLTVFGSTVVRCGLSAMAAWLPVELADRLGIAAAAEVWRFSSRWDVILVWSVVIGAGLYLYDRKWRLR